MEFIDLGEIPFHQHQSLAESFKAALRPCQRHRVPVDAQELAATQALEDRFGVPSASQGCVNVYAFGSNIQELNRFRQQDRPV